MKPYRLLVFDWDGTLMDSQAQIVAVIHTVIGEFGLPPMSAERIGEVIGLALPEAIAGLFPAATPSLQRQIVQRYRYHSSHPDSPAASLFPGTEATLAHLRGMGYVLGVATSKSRHSLEQELELTHLRDYFAVTRCADETRSKPDPLMLKEIMAHLAALPQETVVIGDSEYDLGMAHNAGIDAIAVTSGVHHRERLLAWLPRTCLDSIVELPPWLDGVLVDHH